MASINEKNNDGENKILKIKRTTGGHHYCNVCHDVVGDE